MFTTFTVTAPMGARVGCGQVKLTPQQADPRAHLLKPEGKGVYTVLTPVMFKRGETFGYAGPEEKTLRGTCEPEEKTKTKAEEKTKTKAEEKTKTKAEEKTKTKAEEKTGASEPETTTA